MKYIDEYQGPAECETLAHEIFAAITRPWTIMEVCGGQTHSIIRYGLDLLLPPEITLVHGPGCPVCVTPLEMIDAAIELSHRPEVIMTSFGDMLRVPGSSKDLLSARAAGADVRIVYSPLDAVRLAHDNPEREVVFFSVGFETTAPATAMSVLQARQMGLRNFSLLVSHVRVPPALEALLSSPDVAVNGFIGPGHVCAVMGSREYEPICARFGVPFVITGFEPLDLLKGVLECVRQLEDGRSDIVNCYSRAVRPEGNVQAREMIEQVFQVCDRRWRGIGDIPQGGMELRRELSGFDALCKFGIQVAKESVCEGLCIGGEILRGVKKPVDCPAFGTRCTPEHPLGATMVSSEGACAAYFRYRRGR